MSKITVEVTPDGVYISDEYDEIVMWHIDEIVEYPAVGLVIANALKVAYEEGSDKLRQTLGKELPNHIDNHPIQVDLTPELEAEFNAAIAKMRHEFTEALDRCYFTQKPLQDSLPDEGKDDK